MQFMSGLLGDRLSRALTIMTMSMCVLGCAPARSDSSRAVGGTVLETDFSRAKTWPGMTAVSTGHRDKVYLADAAVGTVDVADSSSPSGGVLFAARNLNGGEIGNEGFVSGKLAVQTKDEDINKYTLSFSLSASSTRPIRVTVESFASKGNRTGGLTTLIYPAAPNFYQRYALDLSAMRSSGAGTFRATDPFVQFGFAVATMPAGYPVQSTYQIRLDNVNYATPAYYVSAKGSDHNDGRSPETAFATPQKALDRAYPGDIVVLMDGTYTANLKPVASFVRSGEPDAWIVLKNYPGQHPILTSNGWNIVDIEQGSNGQHSNAPPLAYLEVRGLHIRGEGDVAKQKYPEAMDQADSRTNSNGIAADGRYSKATIHHLRFADNLVEYCPGCGIGSIDCDWVTVEHNICRDNCWTTIYAPSGISVMGAPNFDSTMNVYKKLVRNNVCCHNQTYEMWKAIGKYSDGNGIILDVNQQSPSHPGAVYMGRTLVQSNLSYDNGGSGIHCVQADRVDIINNTAYHNSASVHLEYPEMFTYNSHDVHFIDNILVAPVANIAAGEKPEPVNTLAGRSNSNVTFSHNVYFGGNIPPVLGDSDVVANPQFDDASIDDKIADFHLRPSSPAIGKGMITSFSPILDIDGRTRLVPPSEGAYER